MNFRKFLVVFTFLAVILGISAYASGNLFQGAFRPIPATPPTFEPDSSKSEKTVGLIESSDSTVFSFNATAPEENAIILYQFTLEMTGSSGFSLKIPDYLSNDTISSYVYLYQYDNKDPSANPKKTLLANQMVAPTSFTGTTAQLTFSTDTGWFIPAGDTFSYEIHLTPDLRYDESDYLDVVLLEDSTDSYDLDIETLTSAGSYLIWASKDKMYHNGYDTVTYTSTSRANVTHLAL